MPVVLPCPSCHRKLRVTDALLGAEVRCPTCGTVFRAPEVETAPTPEEPELESVLPGEERDPQPGPGVSSRESSVAKQARKERSPDLDDCPYCGETVRVGSPTCRNCGKELPLDDEDERPWERSGMRRDSEPHRGSSVLALGIISLVCTPFNICCGVFGLIFGAAGLTTGIMAWVMGQRDLGKMNAGVMDRRGEGNTQAGRICGIVGTSLNALAMTGMVILIVLYGFLLFNIFSIQKKIAPPPNKAPAGAPQQLSSVLYFRCPPLEITIV